MPIPKGKRKAYSVIVAAMQNHGRSLSAAKKIADRAVKHRGVNDKKFKKYTKKK